MGDSPRRSRYDSRGDSPPPPRDSRRSPPPRRPRDDDRGPNEDNANPGNNLYVTGLSMRVTEDELLKHFEREGKVLECRLVVDPRTKESRGFAFVTMAEVDDAEACIKYLNKSTLEGRVISVERAKRKRARTPTPGQYLGVRAAMHGTGGFEERGGGGGRYGGGYGGGGGGYGGGGYGGGGGRGYDEYDRPSYRRSPEYAPYRGRERSPPPYPSYGGRSRSPPPYRGGGRY
eukprot:TRINITY_DN210_c0_g1_i3.p1 TRINITY_DN210_c0_g1~~TRINITY_DN210_c0_g1_i3.p1  ORF type:complete len:231 (+),score=45.26 TRINITY_DN210_c0_g1_i3:121-813(+)